MRTFSRFFAFTTVLLLAAGPAFSAPVVLDWESSIGAPTAHPARRLYLLEWLLVAPIVFGITMRKDVGAIAAKFVQRAGAATKEYSDNASQAGAEWEANTKAAEPSYEQGVNEAIAAKRYGRGVSDAGASKYTNNVVKLGAARYQPGVANSQDAYVKGFSPYADVIRNLQLPPKGPRRSPQNQARANAVALALGNRKVGK